MVHNSLKNKKKDILISIAFFVYCAMIITFIGVFYEINIESDDFFIEMILSGYNGYSSPYTLVGEYPLMKILTILYSRLGIINWFSFLEIACICFSMTFISIIFWQKGSIWSKQLALILPFLFIPFLVINLHYTRTAIVGSYAGMIFAYDSFSKKKHWAWTCLGLTLVLISGSLRFTCFLLALPFVALFVIKCIRKYFGHNKESIKLLVHTQKSIVICFLAFIFFMVAQHVLTEYRTQQNDAVAQYIEFNAMRSSVYDYLPAEYYEAYEEIGISQNDFYMMKSFVINDDIFNAEYYEKWDSFLNEEVSFADKVTTFVDNLCNRLFYYQNGRYKGKMNVFLLLIVLWIIAIFRINKKNCWFLLGNIGLTLIIAIYFVWGGRLPPWVQDGLYFMSAINVLLVSTGMYRDENRIKTKINYWSGYFGIIIAAVIAMALLSNFDRARSTEDNNMEQSLSYMEEHKESVYLLDNFSNIPYPILDTMSCLEPMEKGTWSNILRVGSWYLNHPAYIAQEEKLGLDSPIFNLISKDNVYLFSNNSLEKVEYYQTFFKEHYQCDTEVEKIESWGNYAIFHFYIKE